MSGIQKKGAPKQGGVISPIIANIYLHEVLDKWFDEVVWMRDCLTGLMGKGQG